MSSADSLYFLFLGMDFLFWFFLDLFPDDGFFAAVLGDAAQELHNWPFLNALLVHPLPTHGGACPLQRPNILAFDLQSSTLQIL